MKTASGSLVQMGGIRSNDQNFLWMDVTAHYEYSNSALGQSLVSYNKRSIVSLAVPRRGA